MPTTKRSLLLAATVTIALAAASCGDDDDSATVETTAVTTADTTTSVDTTILGAAADASPDARLPEGIYRTQELTRDQLIATGVAAGFAEEDVAAFLDRDGVERTEIIGLRLAGGGLTLLLQIDGGPEEVGLRATYEVVDDHTLIVTDPSCGGSTTVRYALDGARLTLDAVEGECGGTVGERIAGTLLFESFPFTREEAASTTASTTGTASTYTSTAFVLPFTVTVPGWLPGPATVDEPNFVTWEATDVDRAVRFLVPVELYEPGAINPSPPPDDYITYLLGQAADGAEFADRADITVDGHPATVLTATVGTSLDGSLGCPETGVTAHDCFGLQPDVSLRIAIIDTGDTTLLVWVRDIRGAPAEYATFEAMLASLRFDEDRAPSTTTTVASEAEPETTEPVAVGALDGVYESVRRPGDAEQGCGIDFTEATTLRLEVGAGEYTLSFEGVPTNAGQVEVVDDHVTFADEITARWSVDGTTLTFSEIEGADGYPADCDVAAVWGTQPWERVEAG